MRKKRFDRFARRGLKPALMAGASAAILVGVAAAQAPGRDAPLKMQTNYLGYAASVSTRFTYSNNINLQSGSLGDEEYIFSTLLSGGAIVSAPRVTGIILGDLDVSYLKNQSDFVVNQNIGATSTFTGVDDWLYLDVSGQTSRQLVGDNARFSANINGARGQRANVHSYTASPYIYHQMVDQSSIELRYRWSQVFVDDSDTEFNPTTGSYLNDSRSHEVLASYESGGVFERVRFRTTAYGIETVDDGSTIFPIPFKYRQGSILTEAQVALNEKFALSGAVGYDDVKTDDAAALFFDENKLTGVFWRAGFTARPGRHTRARIEYGRRYNDDFIDADIFYELSNHLVFTAGASRTFQTRAQTISSQFRASQRQTLDFAERLREGQELSPRAIVEAANRIAGVSGGSAQTLGLGTTNSAFASLNAARERTQVYLTGTYSDTDFGFRRVKSYGATLNADRRLSRRLTGYGNVSWRHTDTAIDTATCIAEPRVFGFDITDPMFDAATECAGLDVRSGVTDTVFGTVGASYRVYENVSAFLEGSHTKRFADNSLLEYDENTVTAGLTLEF